VRRRAHKESDTGTRTLGHVRRSTHAKATEPVEMTIISQAGPGSRSTPTMTMRRTTAITGWGEGQCEAVEGPTEQAAAAAGAHQTGPGTVAIGTSQATGTREKEVVKM
jgi:hypothetical protein